jgi:hypothetical protein
VFLHWPEREASTPCASKILIPDCVLFIVQERKEKVFHGSDQDFGNKKEQDASSLM